MNITTEEHVLFNKIKELGIQVPKIANVVAQANLLGPRSNINSIPVSMLAQMCPYSAHEPRQFPAWVLMGCNPRKTILTFRKRDGPVIILACKSIQESLLYMQRHRLMMEGLLTRVMMREVELDLDGFHVTNIVTFAHLGRRIDLERMKFHDTHGGRNTTSKGRIKYNKETFPGLMYKSDSCKSGGKKRVALVFKKGKVVITGPESMSSVYSLYLEVYEVISQYFIESESSDPEDDDVDELDLALVNVDDCEKIFEEKLEEEEEVLSKVAGDL